MLLTEYPARTALYRLYDADDRLLYVGISWQPDQRWKKHVADLRKEWTDSAASRTLTWFDTRAQAEAAEFVAIKAEVPLHNGSHNYESAPFNPEGWDQFSGVRRKAEALAERLRSEIASGNWQPGKRIPKVREIAAAAGLSVSTTDRAVAILQSDGLLESRHGYGNFVTGPPDTRRPGPWRLR